MPSGPKKRKAAKKKQAKGSGNSNSSSTTHSHHGESDGGELISPVAQQNHQLPFTENIEVDNGSTKSLHSSSNSDDESNLIEKKVMPVVELFQPTEAFPEKKGQQVEEDSSVLDPVKPTNSLPQDISDDSKTEDNGCSDVNDKTVIPEYSDKQPLVASAPQAVQTTSWKGCCGIFELFSSSDR